MSRLKSAHMQAPPVFSRVRIPFPAATRHNSEWTFGQVMEPQVVEARAIAPLAALIARRQAQVVVEDA